MDLDHFTKKLLQKTQARQEKLNKMSQISELNSRKRHTLLHEIGNSVENEIDVGADDSPKRQCMDSPEKHMKESSKITEQTQILQSSQLHNEKNNKENLLGSQPYADDDIPFLHPYRAPGLAGLRKARVNYTDDIQNDSAVVLQKSGHYNKDVYNPIPHSNTAVSAKSEGRKARFAALAAHINQWEDGTCPVSNEQVTYEAGSSKSSHYTNFIGTLNKTVNSSTSKTASESDFCVKTDSSLSVNKIDNSYIDYTNTLPTDVCPKVNNLQNEFEKDMDASDYTENVSETFPNKTGGNNNNSKTYNSSSTSESKSESTVSVKRVHFQETKKNVWDKAILATLESQGFVKSPSALKLSYQYSNSKANAVEVCINEETENCLETSKGENSDVTSSEFVHSHSDSRGKPEDLHNHNPYSIKNHVSDREQVEYNDNVNLQEESTSLKNSATVDSCVAPQKEETAKLNIQAKYTEPISSNTIETCYTDPADLPLSARRALFEKTFLEGNKASDNNDLKGSLVSTRTAFFEKASTAFSNSSNLGHNNTKKTHMDSSSMLSEKQQKPISDGESLKKTVIPNSTVNVAYRNKPLSHSEAKGPTTLSSPLSPSKQVNSHTFYLQQQLLKQTNDWKNNAISTNVAEERKKEMKALLNYWNKKPVPCIPEASAEDDCEVEDSSSDNAIKIAAKSNIEQIISGTNIEDQQSPSLSVNNQKVATENSINVIDEIIEEKECNVTSVNEVEDVTEAVNVCNEIDEALDEVLSEDVLSESNCSNSSLPLHEEPCKRSETNVTSSTDTAQRKQLPDIYLPSYVCDNGTEMPLLHTVSFYRRQKQQSSTPVRTIVRRERVCSPPSPDAEDRVVTTNEQIKILQEEVLNQQTIISQATQALNLCHARREFFGSTEQVEGERLLLIASQKRQAYLNEINHLKTEGALGTTSDNTKGTLILNDIRLPLKREFITAQIEGKLGDAVHHFICLVRHRAHVIATQMLSTSEDVKAGALCFTNHITLQELNNNFSVAFEVYALQAKQEKIPHDKKYHIKKQEHSKIRLTPKAKKPESKFLSTAVTSPCNASAVRTPSFAVVGSLTLKLQNCNRKSYSLEKVPYMSPLEGLLLANIQLHADHNIECRGFLTMFEDVSGFGAWHRRWCVLQGKQLAFWKYPEDEKQKCSIGMIDLSQCVTENVGLIPRDICARPHTFRLDIVRAKKEGDKETLISSISLTATFIKHLLSADTKEERIFWCNNLNKALTTIRKWTPQNLFTENTGFSSMIK